MGLPPLAVIGEDPAHKDWTQWDYRLLKAYELYNDMKNNQGFPMYWDRSDRVRFDIESYTSKSKAALDRAEEQASKSKAKNHGKILYAVPKTIDGGPLPTLEEFLEDQAVKRKMMSGKFKIGEDKFSNAEWKPE